MPMKDFRAPNEQCLAAFPSAALGASSGSAAIFNAVTRHGTEALLAALFKKYE